MIAQKLTAAIAAVCPTHGVSIGRKDDKQTWRIDFKNEATSEQRMAAQAVVASFDPVAAEQTIDQSDIDQLEKHIKAVLLCVAQVGGLTVPQIKALFKNKMDSFSQ